MGIKERRERERGELRSKILDAAREMFAADGYDAVTMRRIAQRIEYSATAIYAHFPDKLAVFHALCTADFLTLAESFRSIARIADPIERLRETGRAYARFGLEHPNHYRLMFMTPHPAHGPEDVDIQHGNPEVDAYAFLKLIVGDAAAQGLLRPGFEDVEATAQTVWAGVHGVVSLFIAKCNDAWVEWRPSDEGVDRMLDVLVQGIVREPREVTSDSAVSSAGTRRPAPTSRRGKKA